MHPTALPISWISVLTVSRWDVGADSGLASPPVIEPERVPDIVEALPEGPADTLFFRAENVFSVDAEAEDADTPLDAGAKEEEFEEPMDDTPPVPAVTAAACCQY